MLFVLFGYRSIRDRYAELCRLQGRGERSADGPTRYERYDIAADRGETKDLAAEHSTVAERLSRECEAWFTDVGDRWHAAQQPPATQSFWP